MKNVICASLIALALVGLAAPAPSTAQTAGPSASGSFRFTAPDGATRFVEFAAETDSTGTTTGRMTCNDTSRVPDVAGGSEPDPRGDKNTPTEFFASVEFDTLKVEKNRAVMGGVVKESSHSNYVGRWVQLVVEDNAANPRLTDLLAWSFCPPQPGGWIPSDAERKDDDGAWLRWWATDFERKDDVGVPSRSVIPGEARGCEVYTMAAYSSYFDMEKWEGDIVVRP